MLALCTVRIVLSSESPATFPPSPSPLLRSSLPPHVLWHLHWGKCVPITRLDACSHSGQRLNGSAPYPSLGLKISSLPPSTIKSPCYTDLPSGPPRPSRAALVGGACGWAVDLCGGCSLAVEVILLVRGLGLEVGTARLLVGEAEVRQAATSRA